MPKCHFCERGPVGVEGHQDLFVSRLDARHMLFSCRACGCLWERQVPMGGTLLWCEPARGRSAGVALPGRPVLSASRGGGRG